MKKLLLLLLLFPLFLHAQSTIHIAATRDTICHGSPLTFSAVMTGTVTPHYRWTVNSSNAGADSTGFTSSTLNDHDTVRCRLTNASGDTVYAISNDMVITVQFPVAAAITPPATAEVCVGATLSLSATPAGGVWASRFGYTTVSASGVVTGIVGGGEGGPATDHLIYTIINACGIATDSVAIDVQSRPSAVFVLGSGFDNTICMGVPLAINDFDGVPGIMTSLYGHVLCMGDRLEGLSVGSDVIRNVYSNECGSDTFTRNVTVLSRPPVTPINISSPNLCLSDSMTLSDTTTYNVYWQVKGDAILSPGGYAHSQTLKGATPGTDTIMLYVSNVCGASTNSAVINVLPPGPISGISSVCAGQTTAFTNGYAGGGWTSNNSAVATVDGSGSITSIGAGVATISYTIGTCTALKTLSVATQPEAISGSDLLCTSATIQMTETVAIGRWSSSDTHVATVDADGLVNPLNPGIVVISYTTNEGCFATKTVTVNQTPSALEGADEVCKDYSIVVTNATTEGKWSTNSKLISVDNDGMVTGVAAGMAAVTYTSKDGCPVTKQIVVEDCEGAVNTFPNPVRGQVTLYVLAPEYTSARIISILGQAVGTIPLQGVKTTADVSALPAGVYFVLLEGNGKQRVTKLVKD